MQVSGSGMKSCHASAPVPPEQLKPVLHEKIERMNGEQLALLARVLLQLEAEQAADRLSEAFGADQAQQFRAEPRYARQSASTPTSFSKSSGGSSPIIRFSARCWMAGSRWRKVATLPALPDQIHSNIRQARPQQARDFCNHFAYRCYVPRGTKFCNSTVQLRSPFTDRLRQ